MCLQNVSFDVAEPELFPETAIWHPMAPNGGFFEDMKEYINWYDTRKDTKFAKDAPVIGLVMQRSHLVTGDHGHYDGARRSLCRSAVFAAPGHVLPRLLLVCVAATVLPCPSLRVLFERLQDRACV